MVTSELGSSARNVDSSRELISAVTDRLFSFAAAVTFRLNGSGIRKLN
jgi:hypothetical protein